MRRNLLALAVAAVAGFGVILGSLADARAADVPTYQYYKAQPANVFSWQGFYIKGDLGYAVGDVNYSGLGAAITVEPRGFTAGLGAGYNFHLTRSWVLGIEGDFNYAAADRAVGIAPGIALSSEIDYYATLRARLGYSFGTWMVYGHAGGVWAHLASNVSGVGLSADDFASGLAYGAGVEAALWGGWSGRFEWTRLDFDSVQNFGIGTLNTASNVDIFKVGLAYRFGG